MLKTLGPALIYALVGGGLAFGVLTYIQNNAKQKERIQTIQSEENTRQRAIEAVRTSPKTVKDSLDYLRNRNK